MANIFDVAKYILKREGVISTFKLQKLCYYVQAWCLVWEDQPMFNEEFQAWSSGPVCIELHNSLREDLGNNVFKIIEEDIPNTYCQNNLTQDQMESIDEVLEYYGDWKPWQLNDLVHREQPWKEAREKADVRIGYPCNEIITKESMKQYYSSL